MGFTVIFFCITKKEVKYNTYLVCVRRVQASCWTPPGPIAHSQDEKKNTIQNYKKVNTIKQCCEGKFTEFDVWGPRAEMLC